jgi:hypothetical protein
VAPFASISAFVARQFRDVVGRAPTAAESDRWVGELRVGSRRPADLVASLRASADNQVNVDPVIRLYRAYFLRAPDVDGLRFWVGRRRAGVSIAWISQSFASSAEFRARYGALTNRAFVEQVYLNVLGRPGDAAGVTFWTRQLDIRARDRGSVMVGFSESAENKAAAAPRVTAAALHLLLLGRAPTVEEETVTVASLAGGATVADVAAVILASAEYRAHVAG